MVRFFLCAFTATLLIGCGGGGGGSANANFTTNTVPDTILNAAFEPKQAQASLFENQNFSNSYRQPEHLSATLNVDGIDPVKVFPTISADKPIFSRLDIDVSNLSRKLIIFATPSTQIAAGTYKGALTVTLYKDAAKTQAYTLGNGGIFPYTINVDPELVITVKIDGVVQSQRITSSTMAVTDINNNTIYWQAINPQATFRLKPGQVVELKSSIPVTWRGPNSWYPYGWLWQAPEETETTFRQVTMPLQNSPGLTNAPFVAMPKIGTKQFGAGFLVDVFP